MKKFLLLLLLFPFVLHAQVNRTVTYDGLTREYIEYVPSSYDGSTAVPLLFVLHGLGDTDDNMSNIGFQQLAEIHNYIVITPQAIFAEVLTFPVGTAWNSGAGYNPFNPNDPITLNPDVDDVGFISFLIDSTDNHYNIDLRRVYSTGFSMGGFMSNRLACELNDRIAAIASVAGTIGSALTCEPGKSVPFLHFHGTADGTVAYTNNNFGTDAEETVEFWATNNDCDVSPTITAMPDNAADGITISKIVYNNCDDDTEFYKADGAGHSWLREPNNDISYTPIIWEFLSRQRLATSCETVTVDLGDDVTLNEGESVVLDATTTDATYLWSTGATTATITVTSSGTYSVTITVDGCEARDDVDVDFITGLFGNEKAFQFSIYPNPIASKGTIAINVDHSTIGTFSIYDLLGKQVLQQPIALVFGDNRIEFETTDLAKGTYMLTIDLEGAKVSKPILVY